MQHNTKKKRNVHYAKEREEYEDDTKGIEITPLEGENEENKKLRGPYERNDWIGRSFKEKPLSRWDTRDVLEWAEEQNSVPDTVASELADHRFRGIDLPQITKQKLQAYGIDSDEASQAQDAVENLLVERAREDPLEDVETVLKLTESAKPQLDGKPIDEKPPSRHSAEDDSLEFTQEAHPSREQRWGNAIEFVFALVSYAVGLGNVWRFPYLAYANGGGAFLIPYFIFLFFLGMPMFVMELGVGQLFQFGPLRVWATISPRLAGIGIASIIVAAVVSVYYNVIVGWALFYLFQSFRSSLPYNGDTERYWFEEAIGVSETVNNMESMNWPMFGTLIVAWVLVFIIIFRGAQSSGKTSYFTALFPYTVLFILLIRASTLENAAEGVKHFFTPDFSQLADFGVWISAATQMFYSLGIGWGALVAFSSFNDRKHDFVRDAYVITGVNAFTSLLAGITVFSAIGFIAKKKGQEVSEVAASGSGLAFVALPELLVEFPVEQLFAFLFFLMLGTLGIGSEAAMVMTVRNGILQSKSMEWLTKRFSPAQVSFLICAVMFVFGIFFVTDVGFYLVNIFDNFAAAVSLVIVVLLELYGVLGIYGRKKFVTQCEQMTGKKIPKWVTISWITVCPLLFVIIILGILVEYPKGSYENIGCLAGVRQTGDCEGLTWITIAGYFISFSSLAPIVYFACVNWKKPRPQIKAAQAIEQLREDRIMQQEVGQVHPFDLPKKEFEELLAERHDKIAEVLREREGEESTSFSDEWGSHEDEDQLLGNRGSSSTDA
eukprot:gb/GECG01000399.1/.p1 GENE.gb/GECG01000399.1/~~gb/GECG01000399.1/.p1  ORF type:complete len:776 (+),score=105.81 gb/GECG01000399.1/:1-2328(+)